MTLKSRISDSYLVGLLAGVISITLFYYSLHALRNFLIRSSGNETLLKPPAVEMIAIVINVILFRIIIINFQKEKTGKGFLFSTVILALAYFYYFFKMNR